MMFLKPELRGKTNFPMENSSFHLYEHRVSKADSKLHIVLQQPRKSIFNRDDDRKASALWPNIKLNFTPESQKENKNGRQRYALIYLDGVLTSNECLKISFRHVRIVLK